MTTTCAGQSQEGPRGEVEKWHAGLAMPIPVPLASFAGVSPAALLTPRFVFCLVFVLVAVGAASS